MGGPEKDQVKDVSSHVIVLDSMVSKVESLSNVNIVHYIIYIFHEVALFFRKLVSNISVSIVHSKVPEVECYLARFIWARSSFK